MSELRVGVVAAQLDTLNALGLVGPQGGRSPVAALNCQKQGDSSYYNGQCRPNNVHNSLTCNGQLGQGEFYSA